jgi:hypothetical protein
MEGRTNIKAELANVEQQLAALSQPKPPRPAETVREALGAASVPANVWKYSQESASIRDSRYFERVCAVVVALRQELAAAEDYQQLDVRARELRRALATAPLVAISDPLPESFAATIGRIVPLDGRAGVALLLTLVIEIMSCFGLAALRVLREEQRRETVPPEVSQRPKAKTPAREPRVSPQGKPPQLVPQSSLRAARIGERAGRGAISTDQAEPPSNLLVLTPASREPLHKDVRRSAARSSGSSISLVGSHILEFARARLRSVAGTSLSASNLRATYEAWCAEHAHEPLSQQKLGAELRRLGFVKWKSCGLIHYRDLQLAA